MKRTQNQTNRTREERFVKNKLILYNKANEILVYRGLDILFLPSTQYLSSDKLGNIPKETFVHEIEPQAPIPFDSDDLEEIFSKTKSLSHLGVDNNKLTRTELIKIKKYYTAFANFQKNVVKNINPIETRYGNIPPKVMNIDDCIAWLETGFDFDDNPSNTLTALKRVKAKRMENKIC